MERRASPHTCDTYAYAFRLLFAFMSRQFGVAPADLALEQLARRSCCGSSNISRRSSTTLPRLFHGEYVAIELELSGGRTRALGLLLCYMGWVDRNLGSAPCRGLIVASDIADEVRTAVRRVPGVGLLRYGTAMSVEPVSV